jgi:hypothetical protein
MMRKILILFVLLSTIIVTAQEDKTVTLTVSGTGKTLEEAKNNALRSAIEQAFGAFISSKTEILNDNLVKDEIVSVANGNIQKFEIISQVEIPNNGYAMTLNATVSISKLTSFAQSKGVSIEIKGGLFAANIIQQELNEKAELISLQNILNTSNELLKKSFDYSIERKGTPTLNNGKYDIPLRITVKLNKNFYQFRKYFINSLSGLTMNESEITNYEEIKKSIGQLIVRKDSLNFQEDLYYKKYNFNTNNEQWRVNVDDFNENLEKVFYCGSKPLGDHMMQLNLDDCFEIFSNKELKDRFKRWGWNVAPADIIYKVDKKDRGYSKIFFRNPTSTALLNEYFNNIKNQILNFETSNNVELITGLDLIKIKKNNINNDFNVVLKNTYGYAEVKNIFKYYDEYQKNNFFNFDSQNANFSQFIYRAVNGQKEYFPNLLSILPIKTTSKIILASFSKFKEDDVITTIDFIDTKSLEEIKLLSEYKIKPLE